MSATYRYTLDLDNSKGLMILSDISLSYNIVTGILGFFVALYYSCKILDDILQDFYDRW
ncbi:hypothetical protein SDC9_129733 [bioreactor metagenome]|uniref:Uncharacterized protein n=1 Tax=bioreactor metagenome TaxID=1076179 RepID=A0A645D0N6_9ZZZZ